MSEVSASNAIVAVVSYYAEELARASTERDQFKQLMESTGKQLARSIGLLQEAERLLQWFQGVEVGDDVVLQQLIAVVEGWRTNYRKLVQNELPKASR